MAERIGIDVEIMGYEQAERKLEELDKIAKSLSAKDIRIRVNGEVTNVADRIQQLQRNLQSLKAEKIRIQAEGGNLRRVNKEIQQTQASLQRLQAVAKNAAPSFNKLFSTYVSRINHMGQAMTQLGNAMVKFANPMRTILRGTLYGAGFALLNMATQGLRGAAERADIMSTYAPIMQSLGHSAEEANVAVNNLYEAVLGLPTGLDEIVEQHKLLTVAIGDVTKAEKLAIAANNAYIAGGAADNIVNIGQRELLTLAQTGELNARQWMALQKAIPTAWKEIQDNFRKTKGIDDLRSALSDGTIAAQEFLDELVKVGTTGQTADVVVRMKHTFSAVTANIQNAFRRMGENIFKTLDMVFERAYGKDTIDMLLDLKNGIDAISESVQGWIKANPEKITNFINALKSFNWSGAINGVLNGLAFNLNLIGKALNKFGQGRGIEKFMQFMAMSGFLGRGLLIGGGAVRGTRHITGFLGAAANVGIWRALRKQAAGITDLGMSKHTIPNITADWWQREYGATPVLSPLVESINQVPAVSRLERMTALSKGMIELSKGIGAMAGAVAAVGISGFAVFRSIKTMIADMIEISRMVGSVDWGVIGKISTTFALFTGIFTSISAAVGYATLGEVALGVGAIGGILSIIAGFAAFDTWLLKKGLQNVNEALDLGSKIISKAKSFKNYNKSDFSNVLSSFKGIHNLVSDIMSEYGTSKIQNIGSVKKFIESINAIVEGVADIYKVIAKINSAKGSTNTIKFQQLMMGIKELYKQLQSDFELWGTSKDDTKLKNAQNVADVMENLKASIYAMREIFDTIMEVSNLEGYSADTLKTAKERILSLGTSLSEIYASFLNLFSGEVGNAKKTGSIVSQNTVDNIGKMNEAIQGIGESASAMLGMIDNLTKLSQANVPQVASILPKVSAIMDDVWNIYKQWKLKDFGTTSGGEKGSFANMTNSLAYFSKALNSINTIINQLAVIGKNANMSSINLENVRTIFSNLRQVMSAFMGEGAIAKLTGNGTSLLDVDASGLASQLSSFATALGSVSEVADKLKELSGKTVDTAGIESLASSIKSSVSALMSAFEGGGEFDAAALSAKINLFKMAIDGIVQTLQTIGNAAGSDGGIQIIVQFKQPQLLGLTNLLTQLKQAKTKIENALNDIRNINTNISLSVYINASVSDNFDSAFGGAISRLHSYRAQMHSSGGSVSVHAHNGRYIHPQYRAKGGTLFKKRGSDTVPAMLTAGEFVHNKRAVKAFGLDFMNKVNNLDIHGAMQSLYARANGMASRTTNITHNVYNNVNNTNNQTVYTNSPNFAYKRSKRALQGI